MSTDDDQDEQIRVPQPPDGRPGGGHGSPADARAWYLGQRSMPAEPEYSVEPADPSVASQGARMTTTKRRRAKAQETDTIETFEAGSAGGTFEEAEQYLASTVVPLDFSAAADVEIQSQTITITGVSTSSQAGVQNTFLHNSDALALVINIAVSQDIINAGRRFNANFQIVELGTNNVKVNNVTANSAFAWGTNFWISRGNNWGPTPNDYTTPAKWGLSPGLYLFRSTVEVIGIGAFSVSNEVPFRVR